MTPFRTLTLNSLRTPLFRNSIHIPVQFKAKEYAKHADGHNLKEYDEQNIVISWEQN